MSCQCLALSAHATGHGDEGNPLVLALGLFPDCCEEDQVPAMKCQAWEDIMQVRTTCAQLDINRLGSTGLSMVTELPWLPVLACILYVSSTTQSIILVG